MATFHMHAQVIGRSGGRSSVACAAYRSRSCIDDEELGRRVDYSAKRDLVHSSILLPMGAPDELGDRATLWNTVERCERRRDAQLAREFTFALPRELSLDEAVDLARRFVQEAFVARGMIADLNIHAPKARDGAANTHAHVMLTLREVTPNGFGLKVRSWNDRKLTMRWRELLAVRTNQALAAAGHGARVDHRSYAERGIGLAPQPKLGPRGARVDGERQEAASATAAANGARIEADVTLALSALTEHASTFSEQDVARLLHRNTADSEQFRRLRAKIMAHPSVRRVGTDAGDRVRYSTEEVIAREERLLAEAAALARDGRNGVATVGHAEGLGPQQVAALGHVAASGDLKLVVGYAGTGKSRTLASARVAWEVAGHRVIGAALSGMAAEALEHGSGIKSRTLASHELRWTRGTDALGSRDVLVIDEAGLVGSRQMARLVAAVRKAGAKLVLAGDHEQLQSIEAGAVFRVLVERHGAAELTAVRRQRAGWMRAATIDLAHARTGAALSRYDAAGMVHGSADRAQAMAKLVAQWSYDVAAHPEQSHAIMAGTRATVAELNAMAREAMRQQGRLQGEDVEMRTERGARRFAAGERIAFLRNDTGMGVRNGTLGRVQAVERGKLTVELDSGKVLSFDPNAYAAVDHGYAQTIHKSQGQNVGRVQVLAEGNMDRHSTYVALTRHSDTVNLHYAQDQFATKRALGERLGRDGRKDMVADYAEGGKLSAGVKAVAAQVRQRQQGRAAAIRATARQRSAHRGRGVRL